MHSPSETIHRWLCSSRLDEGAHVRAAYQQIDRAEEIGAGHWLNHSMADIDRVIAAAAQMDLKLPARSVRARARAELAAYIDRVVRPATADPRIRKLSQRLLEARQGYDIGVRTVDGKPMIRWDGKAGLKLLCPDDAREEAMRVQRQYVPHIMELLEQGCEAHYVVLTQPNAEPGKLRAGMNKIFRRLNSIMRACKRKDRPFPIVGALAILEAPLSASRTWHPHLNVLLICDGWLDWKKLRERWHWNLEVRKLEGSQPVIESALRELIKYAVRALPEKSSSKARTALDEGTVPIQDIAPALTQYTAAEFLEWLEAHRGFRRTRSYGALYGLQKPPKEDTTGVVWVGRGKWDGSAFRERFPLLESIPGHKSTTANYRELLKLHLQRLTGPPEVQRERLATMQEALAAWHSAPKLMQ